MPKNSLNTIIAILKREVISLKNNHLTLFTSIIYLILCGYIIHSISMMMGTLDPRIFTREIIRLGVFFIPVFTMNLIASDRLTGELELIMAAGVKPTQYILGKYKFIQSIFVIFTLYLLSIPEVYKIFGVVSSSFNWENYLVALLGYFLFTSLYLSLGILISSMNQYPATSGGITLGIFLGIFFLETFPVFFPDINFVPPLSEGGGTMPSFSSDMRLSAPGIASFCET